MHIKRPILIDNNTILVVTKGPEENTIYNGQRAINIGKNTIDEERAFKAI